MEGRFDKIPSPRLSIAVETTMAVFLLLTCSKSPAIYTPIYDLAAAGSSALLAECQNAQDAAAIPAVTYTTALATSFGGTTVQNLVMGADNTAGNTTYRFYAPAANSVDLLTYAAATSSMDAPATTTAMTRDPQSGVFYTAALAHPVGTYYRYRVNCMKVYLGGTPMKEFQRYIPDPYGRAQAGASGHSIVGNKNDAYAWGASETTWYGAGVGKRPNTKDYVVYELHVGDLTGDNYGSCNSTACAHDGTTSFAVLSSNGNRAKFKGVQDLIPYLQQLGVNAVELMPIHEYSVDAGSAGNPESYSWGYLPTSFFAPESSYATNAASVTSITTELKDMIKALHAAGIAVILDVVLTHTANYYNYLYFTDPFNRNYFRLTGNDWQNLGTGNWINDDKASRPFVHKLVRDNLRYWVKDYHVDGFRFDLVVGTLQNTLLDIQNEICAPAAGACTNFTDNQGTAIKPPNFWSAENWLGATRHTFMVQSNTSSAANPFISFNGAMRDLDYAGFSQWNDYYREAVKGFIQGKTDTTTTARTRKAAGEFSKTRDDGVSQAVSLHPVDTLNYIESHDEETVAHAVQGNIFKAAAGVFILMTSHGIPMLQEGQEFMRDKAQQNQTQEANALKWNLLATNRPFFHFASYLVKLRKACPAFRFGVDPATDGNADTYSVLDAADNQNYNFFTKYEPGGSACGAGAPANPPHPQAIVNGRREFRILVNMTNVSKSFTVETGGSRWCALAQVSDTDGSESTPGADFYLNGVTTIAGITNIASWGYSTNTWLVAPLTAVILTKISGAGNCSTG